MPARPDSPRFALFGLITALHFALYIGSLQFTTIAHGLALLYTAPLLGAILVNLLAPPVITGGLVLGVLLPGETPTFYRVVGVILTLLGIVPVL